MKIYNYKWLMLLLAGLVVACDSDDDNGSQTEEPVEYTSGTADFSHYVAIGNSLTAGLTDGALFIAGQQNSLPNILAQQFALAGGGEFTQPLVNDNIGGLILGDNVILEPRLFFNGSGPQRLDATPTTDVSNILTGPFNNLGIPGAKSFHLTYSAYGNIAGVPTFQSNPYFVRMASNPSATVLQDALAQNPTFFSLWIGINDVLSYASSGGAGENQEGNLNPATYGLNDITDPMVFEMVYKGIVEVLVARGAQGVLANIPDVIKAPYFTTVPYQPLDPTNAAFGPMIPTLNQTFAGLNQVFTALGVPERSIVFSTTGASAVVVKDETLTNLESQIIAVLTQGGANPLIAKIFGKLYGQARHATAEDLLVLPSSSIIGKLDEEAFAMLQEEGFPAETAGQLAINGITFPLGDKWVLLPSEQEDVLEATAAFNESIEEAAEEYELAFVDVNSILTEVADTGVEFDEFSLNARLVFGGAFSLDGIHPTARGYAYLANKFLEAINETYGSNLPPVKAVDYNTVYPVSF